MLFTIWIVFHVIVCVALVLVVLMQSSKGEGLAGSAFGGGGGGLSGAVFGGRGAASFLSKATTVLAIVFMFNCGALALMSSNRQTASTSEAGQVEDSAVTREAQKEYEQQMQRRQQQQADSAAAAAAGSDTSQAIDLEQLMNESSPQTQDTASGQ